MSNLTDALIAAKLVGGSGGSGGGSGLPEVTADDNGDVLTVVDGAWGKATPSSGSGAVIIHFDDDTGVCDTTWQDIYDALAAGKRVLYLYQETSYVSQQPIYIAMWEGGAGGGRIYSILDTPNASGSKLASCDSPTGYPVFSGGE